MHLLFLVANLLEASPNFCLQRFAATLNLYSKADKTEQDNRYGNDDKVKILRKYLVQFFEFLQNPKLLNFHILNSKTKSMLYRKDI